VYNKDTVGYSCEQRWFNLFVDIEAQQDAPTQYKVHKKMIRYMPDEDTKEEDLCHFHFTQTHGCQDFFQIFQDNPNFLEVSGY
jgi:hypothetical protein